MREGTIIDFFTLVNETPALQRDLAELATKHGFRFASTPLSEDELGAVSGGTEMTQMSQLKLQNEQEQVTRDTTILASLIKTMNDTQSAIIRNIGG